VDKSVSARERCDTHVDDIAKSWHG